MGKPGRPSSYTPQIAREICERLAAGEPLTVICRDEHMPCDDTVRAWAERDESLSRDIACARAIGFDVLAAQCLEIADTPEVGEIVTEKPLVVEGKPIEGAIIREVKTDDMLGHRKLRIDTRLKLLAKWDPKRYGERTTIAGDPEAPLAPPADPAAALAAILAAAQQRRENDGSDLA
jgi:hypothetical protein